MWLIPLLANTKKRMMGPTKNLTILSCENVEFPYDFASGKLAIHPRLMKNNFLATEINGEFKFFVVMKDVVFEEIRSDFLHSDPDSIENETSEIKSFCIVEGDDLKAVLILADGRIYRSDMEEYAVDQFLFEQIGAVEGGIRAASWSPDGSILVLVTGMNRRVLLSRCFEPIEEGPVQVENYGSEEMISIGWGKKETQFHGTLGKAAAITVAQIKMESVEGDDGVARISWRADGAYFAISTVDSGPGRRIRVYDRSGNLLSTSEPVEGLESALAWRPNGSLIASTQFIKAQNRRQVIFFERNGLRHGEFILEDPKRRVKDLFWSSDSNVLAILYEGGDLELWSSSNYHWYLKKALTFNTAINFVSWDNEKLALSVATKNELFSFSLVWDQIVDNSCVLVVDGKTLHLTPLAISNIPPPLSLFQMSIEGCRVVQAACLKCLNSKEQIYRLAVAKKGCLEIYSVKLSIKQADCSYNIENAYNVEDDIIQIEASLNGFMALSRSGRKVFIIDESSDKLLHLEFEGKCIRIIKDSSNLFFEDGSVQELVEGSHSLELRSNLMNKGEWISFLSKEAVYLVMNEKGWLWMNDNLIMNQATSFCVTDQFVLITTHTHQLIFLPRGGSDHSICDSWDSLARIALEGQSGNEELQRRVERGALLVSAVPEASAVVLQMPRGNLETVNPRAMVLANLRQHLNALEYRAAYALCRRHRIDLNILHDHAPELFLQTIGKFVKDLESVDHLNIFLSSLRDEDVTKSKYSGFSTINSASAKDKDANNAVFKDKINSVSEAILRVLKEENLLVWIDSIVTVYVVQNPPRLEEALGSIIALTEDPGSSNEIVEKSMKYLLFLVPAEKLFNVALGMYELPLTLSIGRRSQMDPKDFEPFLEELYRLPELKRKFRINDHLQRYAKALECLFLDPESEEKDFLIYMQKYNLYKEAIVISAPKPDVYVSVLNVFGDNLIQIDPTSAVCCFKRAENWQKVVEASIVAGCWMEYLMACKNLNRSNPETGEIEALIKVLRTQSKFKEAVHFARLSGSPDEFCFDLAVELGLFAEAALIMQPTSEIYQNALEEHGQRLLNRLTELCTDFQGKSERILRIQRAFLTSNPANKETMTETSGSVDDSVSEMSFRTSNTTIKTRTTSASRRSNASSKRTERNRTRDRPGSPFEREFLLFNIRELIAQIHKLAPEIKEALKCLVQFGCSKDLALNQPRSIHALYDKLSKAVFKFVEEFRKIQVPQIWGFNSNGQAINEQGVLIENPLIDPLEAKFELPSEFGVSSNWEIKLF